MTLSDAIALLESWRACDSDPTDALPWLRSLPPETTLDEAYNACPRSDWLMWLHCRAGVDRKIVTNVACACVRAALARVASVDARIVIETVEAWTRDEASIEDVRAAKKSVYAVYSRAWYISVGPPELRVRNRARGAVCLAAAYTAALVDADTTVAANAAALAAVFATKAARAIDAIDAIDAANADAAAARQAALVRSIIPWSVMSAALGAVCAK